MNPLVALLLGLPLVLPGRLVWDRLLAASLLMATSSSSAATGYLLIGVYTLGFILPFLAVGFFTGAVLSFFKTTSKGCPVYS